MEDVLQVPNEFLAVLVAAVPGDDARLGVLVVERVQAPGQPHVDDLVAASRVHLSQEFEHVVVQGDAVPHLLPGFAGQLEEATGV